MTNCSCAVADCHYNRRNVRKQQLDIVFHSFPAEAELRQKWVKFCSRGAGWQPKPTDAVCSTHFRKQDYQMHKSPMMAPFYLRRLHIKAFPTIYEGSALPIATNIKIERKDRLKLEEELYKKDEHVDIDDICEMKFGAKTRRPTSSILSKIVYRLRSFPNVCAFCYKTITTEQVFLPFNSKHEELQCTIGQKFDEITGDKNERTDGITLDHLLPDKTCEECLEIMVKFHQYQRQLQCLRKFSTGLARLLKGNRKPLQTLYEEQGSYLARVLKNLNICPGPEERVTLERLELEVASYGPIRKYTLFSPKPAPKFMVQTWHKSTQGDSNTTAQVNSSASVQAKEKHDAPDPVGMEMEVLEEDSGTVKKTQAATQASASQKPSAVQQQANSPDKRPRGRPPKVEAPTQRTWMCPYVAVCRQTFLDEPSLTQHIASRHKYFSCKACGSKIKFYELYIKHVESHAIARALLLSHNKKEPKKDLECKNCGKVFVSEELLRRHETTHAGERNFVCGTCLGTFSTNDEFGKHKCPTVPIMLETGEDPFAEPVRKKPAQKLYLGNCSKLDNNEGSSTGDMEMEAEYLDEALLQDDSEEHEIEV